MRIIRIASNNAKTFGFALEAKYPGVSLDLADIGHVIVINYISVDKRGQGLGTSVISDLQQFASSNDKYLFVHPSGKEQSKVESFYLKNGFTPIHPKERYDKNSPLFSPGAQYWFWKAQKE